MKTTQYYPLLQTYDVAATAAFYQEHFGFRPLFEADWYVHLQQEGNEHVNLAIVHADHESIPVEGRGPTRGVIFTFEVEDAEAEDQRLRQAQVAVVQPLRDEPHGQRHLIVRDPNGVLVDVVQPIPPAEEFLNGYADGVAATESSV